jgi:hypothetical protein
MVMDHQIQIQSMGMIDLIVQQVNDKITKDWKEIHFENDIFLRKNKRDLFKIQEINFIST